MDTTIKFIMDLLINGGQTIHEMTNHNYIAELPRSDMNLSGSKKTVVGMTIVSSSKESYFMSTIRGYVRSSIVVQVEVLTAYENNDKHCRAVVEELSNIFSNEKYFGSYRIIIDGIKSDVKPSETPARWSGSISLNITRFDPI
jgi:hypothetical protein